MVQGEYLFAITCTFDQGQTEHIVIVGTRRELIVMEKNTIKNIYQTI